MKTYICVEVCTACGYDDIGEKDTMRINTMVIAASIGHANPNHHHTYEIHTRTLFVHSSISDQLYDDYFFSSTCSVD